MDNLNFEALRDVNLRRVSSFGHGNLDEGWNPAEWDCALAGETGELCNLLKKLIRHPSDPTPAELELMCAKELADVIIYADLLAAKLDIDLGAAVRDKFNEVSDRHGYGIGLAEED